MTRGVRSGGHRAHAFAARVFLALALILAAVLVARPDPVCEAPGLILRHLAPPPAAADT